MWRTLTAFLICVLFSCCTPSSVEEWRKGAEAGDANAQLMVGKAYANGNGVAKDAAEALKWFRMAAEKGGAEAQFEVGCAYANGQGTAKNPGVAAQWYRKAAEQGHWGGQEFLGTLYLDGDGVPRDFVEGYAWICLAAGSGYSPYSGKHKAMLEKELTAAQIAQGKARFTKLAAQIEEHRKRR